MKPEAKASAGAVKHRSHVTMNRDIDRYVARLTRWKKEIVELRRILLDCELTEEMKWGKPFYTRGTGNVAVIWGFKAHCALGFCKGALLKDRESILVKPGPNTQAVRKIPFVRVQDILKNEPLLKSYIKEAIAVEEAGLEVTYKKISAIKIPQELRDKLAENPKLESAFRALTRGRQRGYIIHFTAAKKTETRISRIEKCMPDILGGKGMNDR